MNITAQKISKASFFKLNLIAFGIGFFFFFLICGVAAIFGAETVKWEGQPVTGINGLLLALAMWPFFTLFITAFLWVFGVFGLWVYSFFKPIKVRFKGSVTSEETTNSSQASE